MSSIQERVGDFADSNSGIFFAVGDAVEGSWPNLSWVARNFPGQKICFLHVLQPSRLIPSENAPQDGHGQEVIKKYLRMWRDIGLEGEEVSIEMEKVEEGIVELISELGIKDLVIGAAAWEMGYIGSKITRYVCDNGAASCQIWFIHKGHLIKTRYEQVVTEVGGFKKEMYEESVRREKANKESAEAACKAEAAKNQPNEEMQLIKDETEGDNFDWNGIFESCSSQFSLISDSSFSASNAPRAPQIVDLSPVDDELHKQLEQAMAAADNSKRRAFEESVRRRKAEKDAVEAARQANVAERMYTEEMGLRKELEVELLIKKQELEKMSSELVTAMEERNSALWHKLLLEMEIADSKKKAVEFKEKIESAVELLRSYKNQLNELKAERDLALRSNAPSSFASFPQFLTEISYKDIEDATRHFQPSLKIEEDEGNLRFYKCLFRGTEVVIKIIYADSSQGSSEYRQEVEVLSRLRHPNIVTLIGACPEAYAIVHEYFPNGSLQDRLSCKDNSSPLPWQTRISIAADLCSALIFLHSSKPHCIVHGHLQPSNIFLDANFISKLSDFGTCHAISRTRSAVSRRIQPKGTFAYLDPEFHTAVQPEPTPQLDVYAFGIILLRLLTGREAWGIAKEVQRGLASGKLKSFFDSSAGDWPYLQARQLTHIALRCADVNRENRPDLESEVLRVLESIRASCRGIPLASRLGDDQHSQAPSYYICPILQDVMQDPQVAADGFTYESEAIQGWLRGGHNTSPMTNLKLAHTNLVPNRALRSAIQEWLQHD